METSTTILGTFLILSFIVPIVYVQTKQTRKNKKAIQHLKAFAKQQGFNLTFTEITHRLILGYDENSKTFIYSSLLNSEVNYIVIPMETMERVFVSISEITKNEIDKVTLKLEGKENKELIFYDDVVDEGKDAFVCKHLAQTWADRLN